MKTTLHKSDLTRFERLVSKLTKPSELPQTITLTPCSDGLMLIAFCIDAVLTMIAESNDVFDQLTIPWNIVKELATKKANSFQIEFDSDTTLISWTENGIPQRKSFPVLKLTDLRLPGIPEKLASHTTRLFDAMTQAAKCVDPESTRYSLGTICLRATKSQIISTDGRQALIQDGFAFPWDQDVLCPVSKIFNAKELRDSAATVQVGYEAEHLCFKTDTVTLWFKPIEGKYPKLDQFMNGVDQMTRLTLDKNDATFIADRLDNLPGRDRQFKPVYFSLDDNVALSGHDIDNKTATALRLNGSQYVGSGVKYSVNRDYIKNALNFGIDRFGFDPKECSPIVGRGDNKVFVIMPLDDTEPVCENVTVLDSGVKASLPKKIDKPMIREKSPVLTTAARRVTEPKPEPANAIQAAESLCVKLHETLQSTRRLVKHLKQQRRQDRLVRSTLESLKQLQHV